MKQIKRIEDLNIIAELKTMPNQGILWEIIETQKTGRLYCLNDKAVVILENCSDPFVFIAGELSYDSVDVVINLVKNSKFPMIYCSPKYHHLFINQGWNFHLRTQLQLNSMINTTTEQSNSNNISPIKSIKLFKKCLWYEEKIQLYSSIQNFLKYGTGFVLSLKNGTVVSEVYASIGNGHGEIGVITNPNYRSKGYAVQIASYLIKRLLDTNIIPQWSCNVDNSSSLSTALKLGFEINGYYILLVPNYGNVLCPKLVKWIKTNTYP
jgi:RimJ/RimL family protein N-acetyltransferase